MRIQTDPDPQDSFKYNGTVLTDGYGLALDGRGFLVAHLLDDLKNLSRNIALLPVPYRVRNVPALSRNTKN